MEALTIVSSDPRFDALSWLIQARTLDETRPFMSGFLVEDGPSGQLWIATDGRRLHIYRSEKLSVLPPGNARILKADRSLLIIVPNDESLGQFPNWRKVVPTLNDNAPRYENDDGEAILISGGFPNFKKGTRDLSALILTIAKITNRWLDAAFVLPLVGEVWQAFGDHVSPDHTAIEFQSGPKTVVIMPFEHQ